MLTVFAPAAINDENNVVWVKFYQFTLENIDYAELAQRVNKMVNLYTKASECSTQGGRQKVSSNFKYLSPHIFTKY